MNYYEAKNQRNAKDKPTEWIIVPNGVGGYMLVCLGPNGRQRELDNAA